MVQGFWLVKTLLPAYHIGYKTGEHVVQICVYAHRDTHKNTPVWLCMRTLEAGSIYCMIGSRKYESANNISDQKIFKCGLKWFM